MESESPEGTPVKNHFVSENSDEDDTSDGSLNSDEDCKFSTLVHTSIDYDSDEDKEDLLTSRCKLTTKELQNFKLIDRLGT